MTGTGFLLLSVSLFSGLGLGVLRADWIFLTMGAFGLLLSTLSVAYVGLLGHRIRRQTKRLNSEDTQPTHSVVTGEALNTGFLLPRTSFLFSDFSLRWLDVECQLTIVREGAQFTEQVTFTHKRTFFSRKRDDPPCGFRPNVNRAQGFCPATEGQGHFMRNRFQCSDADGRQHRIGFTRIDLHRFIFASRRSVELAGNQKCGDGECNRTAPNIR